MTSHSVKNDLSAQKHWFFLPNLHHRWLSTLSTHHVYLNQHRNASSYLERKCQIIELCRFKTPLVLILPLKIIKLSVKSLNQYSNQSEVSKSICSKLHHLHISSQSFNVIYMPIPCCFVNELIHFQAHLWTQIPFLLRNCLGFFLV